MMDVVEFRSLLIESLKDKDIKSELLKLLSDDNVSEQLKAYEDKIKALEESAKSAEEKYKNLLSDYNDLSGTSAAVKLEAEGKDKKIAELNETIEKLKSGESDAEKISADRIARLTSEVDELKAAVSAKDAKVSELTASETALKAQIDSLTAAGDDMKKQLESSGSEKNSEIARLTEKVTALTAELETEKAKNAQTEALKKEKAELEAKLSDASSQADSMAAASSAKTAELQKTIADMDVKIVGYVSEIDKLKADAEQKDKLIADLKDSAESRSAGIASEKAALETELAEFKGRYEKLSAEVDTYKAAADSAASKTAEIEQKLAAAQEDIERKDSTISQINTQLQGMLILRQKINEYAETANAYAEEVENARNILAERDSTINSLNARIEEISGKEGELNAKIEQYSEAINTKNSQIEEIGKYAESLKSHAEELTAQVGERNAELSAKSNEIAQLQKDIKAYNSTFGDLTQVFQKYQNLTPATKKGLSDVFNEELTVRSFLSSGAQWGHIQALWEFAQQKINNEDFSDIDTLNQIFVYFLDFHNSSYPTPLYELLDTKPGDAFDEEQHTKIMTREERKAAFFDNKKKGSASEGPVKEVVLHGFKNLRNGRILKPSIVRV
ncbi:MAG: hypothetical protein ACI4J0_02180 [Huintestinicola sp.]|uniref:hypothetical protein n=1 Tax=Huintestinicola sp. TaxID=2981661 RepID=UPI003F122A18